MQPSATASALSPKQIKAVDALLATGDVASAAREMKLNKATLYRWLKEPVFNQAVRDAEARAIDDLARMLVRLCKTATATIYKAMNDQTTPMTVRVRAADIAISRMLQLRELATLEARVTELERNVEAGVNRG